jgi:hypothetical protein
MAFSLNTREELRDLAAGAGFRDIAVTFQHRTIRHASVEDYANGFIQATPVAAKYLALPDGDRKRFGGQVAALLRVSSDLAPMIGSDDFRLCELGRCHDTECHESVAEEPPAAGTGPSFLAMADAELKEISEFVVAPAKAIR